MHNIYKNGTRSVPKLWTAAATIWNTVVTSVEIPAVPSAGLHVTKSSSTLHADQLGVFYKPMDAATPNTFGLSSFKMQLWWPILASLVA